jgi:hypothetical protein
LEEKRCHRLWDKDLAIVQWVHLGLPDMDLITWVIMDMGQWGHHMWVLQAVDRWDLHPWVPQAVDQWDLHLRRMVAVPVLELRTSTVPRVAAKPARPGNAGTVKRTAVITSTK